MAVAAGAPCGSIAGGRGLGHGGGRTGVGEGRWGVGEIHGGHGGDVQRHP
jgi:hypothetical protein